MSFFMESLQNDSSVFHPLISTSPHDYPDEFELSEDIAEGACAALLADKIVANEYDKIVLENSLFIIELAILEGDHHMDPTVRAQMAAKLIHHKYALVQALGLGANDSAVEEFFNLSVLVTECEDGAFANAMPVSWAEMQMTKLIGLEQQDQVDTNIEKYRNRVLTPADHESEYKRVYQRISRQIPRFRRVKDARKEFSRISSIRFESEQDIIRYETAEDVNFQYPYDPHKPLLGPIIKPSASFGQQKFQLRERLASLHRYLHHRQPPHGNHSSFESSQVATEPRRSVIGDDEKERSDMTRFSIGVEEDVEFDDDVEMADPDVEEGDVEDMSEWMGNF